MAGIPPELESRARVSAARAERRWMDTGYLALVIVAVGLLALALLVGVRLNRRAPVVVARPAVVVTDETLLPSAGEPVATAVQLVAEGVATPVAAAAVGVEAGVTAFDAALQGAPAVTVVTAAGVAAAPLPTLPPADGLNVLQDGGIVWRCPNGCATVPICADGAPLKAYARSDAAGATVRVYFTHDMAGYGDLPVNAAAGDLWFCTEDEAQAAGFVRGQ